MSYTSQFRNISLEDVEDLCSRVEKLINETSNTERDCGEDEKQLLSLVASISRERSRKEKTKESLVNVFQDECVADYVSSWIDSVSPKLKEVLQRDMTLMGDGLYYKDLDWRFQATLASRSLLEKCEPKVIMNLSLEERGQNQKTTSTNLQCEVKTLEKMVNSLEEALSEANSPAVRKLMKRYN